MRPDTLGVIGLGALGGSIAWQSARAGIPRVIGYARERRDGVAASRAGALTDLANSIEAVARAADLLVIATPPVATLQLLEDVAAIVTERGILVTDLTSVKEAVVAHASRLELSQRFAGSHPFAGTHQTGFQGATPNRFANAVVYVTPLSGGEGAAREIADFWNRVLRARPVMMDATRHDELLAWTSHLPQAVASALARVLATRAPRGGTVGSGALTTTRLAQSRAELWRDILLLNRSQVLASLEGLDDALGELKRALREGDDKALTRWLESGAVWRSRFDT